MPQRASTGAKVFCFFFSKKKAFLLLSLTAAAPQWPYPGLGAQPDPPAPKIARLPGSPITFPQSDLSSMARAIDWFPQSHPPAPPAVLRANGPAPCGYCHLPDGRGRPENASLRGFPADYIIEQVHAFASGARRAASPDFLPSKYMAAAAHAVTAADLAAAATYFSRLDPQSHTRIVEAATIPAATAWHFVYRFDPARQEPLGQRIIEGPTDRGRFELRDPETAYIAYVPPGAIARGQAIAQSGTRPCITCHGPALAGIAGASPTYLARQLLAFRAKARNDSDAAAMQAVAGHFTDADIIDVAAYVAGRPAWMRK